MHSLRRLRLVLLGFCALVLLGNRPNCDQNRAPTLTCENFSVTVPPGTCVQFTNPCDDHQWTNLPRADGFRLCPAPAGITVETNRSGNQSTTRSICADASVAALVNEPVDYLYGRPGDFGEGVVFISTTAQLSVAATATPATINVGQSSQLNATASGGLPPYTFSWVPVGSLNASNIANPVASPTISTLYTVTVSDSGGQSASASVTVNVATSLIVQADPPVINPGQSSQLSASGAGGTPPYTFSWVPVDSLNSGTVASPIASPLITTTYVLTMTDSLGAQVAGSVTVTVNLVVGASASPATIDAGQSSQLTATAQGGSGSYAFAWAPATGLSSTTIFNPIATPSETTTYMVTVTDAVGTSAEASVTVTVNPPPPTGVTACFVITGTDEAGIGLDGSCSTSTNGEIEFWIWSSSWGASDFTISPFTTIAEPPATDPGPFTITLTVQDVTGAQGSVTMPFTPPSG